MLRVVKPTSPMSTGTWILAAYGPPAGLAAACEMGGRLPGVARLAGLAAALLAPGVATYTAVLSADTAVPSWHDAHRQLPFVFAGSAAAGAGGLAMALVAPADAGPARRLAAMGAALDLCAAGRMERTMGLAAEPYRQGRALPPGPGRRPEPVGPAPHRRWRVGRRDLRSAEPVGGGGVGSGAGGRVGLHPLRGLRRRAAVGGRPEVHRRPPASWRRRRRRRLSTAPGPSGSAGLFHVSNPGSAHSFLSRSRRCVDPATNAGAGSGPRSPIAPLTTRPFRADHPASCLASHRGHKGGLGSRTLRG